jgi:hypothetical protein
MPSDIRILGTGSHRTTWVLYRPQHHNQSHLCPCRNCQCDGLCISNCTDLYFLEFDPEFSHKVLRGGYSCAWLYVSLTLYIILCCYILSSRVLIDYMNSAIVATIARFPYVQDLATLDSLFINTNLAIWSHIEIGIALIASSAATFRPLLAKLKHWAFQRHREELGQPIMCQVVERDSHTPNRSQ